MKKLLSITLTTLLVLFASQAFGQDQIQVSANVLTDIEVNTENVAFGNITIGSEPFISAGDADTDENNDVDDPTVGEIQITADEDDYNVRITSGTSVSLADNGNENTLEFTLRVFDSSENRTSETTGSEGFTVEGGGNETFFIGGSLQSPSESGEFNTNNSSDPIIVEVDYSINM